MEEPTAYRDPIAPYAGIIARLVPLVQFKRVEIDPFKIKNRPLVMVTPESGTTSRAANGAKRLQENCTR